MMTITEAHVVALTHGATTEQLEEARDRLIAAAINERNLSYLELIDRRLSRIYAEGRESCSETCAPHLWQFCSPECEQRAIDAERETATTPTMPNEGNGDQASP